MTSFRLIEQPDQSWQLQYTEGAYWRPVGAPVYDVLLAESVLLALRELPETFDRAPDKHQLVDSLSR